VERGKDPIATINCCKTISNGYLTENRQKLRIT
jgi:hypothetical protein